MKYHGNEQLRKLLLLLFFYSGPKQRKIRTLNLANIFGEVWNTDVHWLLMIMNLCSIDCSSRWIEILVNCLIKTPTHRNEQLLFNFQNAVYGYIACKCRFD